MLKTKFEKKNYKKKNIFFVNSNFPYISSGCSIIVGTLQIIKQNIKNFKIIKLNNFIQNTHFRRAHHRASFWRLKEKLQQGIYKKKTFFKGSEIKSRLFFNIGSFFFFFWTRG